MAQTGRYALMALGLFAVLLGGFYAYLRWDNYNALRDIIAVRVERATGQQLSFNGPVSLEMGADSFLNFRDVVLTNPDWQMIRSTITVDEGRIGLDVPNVIAGGIGTVVQLNTVKVELDRPEQAADMPTAPPPGTVLSAPDAPPLPKFDELRAERLIVIARNMMGQRQLQLQDLKVAPETDDRTRMQASAANTEDIDVTVLTDAIEGGRAWTLSVRSPRSALNVVVEAAAGRKLILRAIADAEQLDVSDLSALMPADPVDALAQQKPFFDAQQSLPIGWLQLIKANLDVQLAEVRAGEAYFERVRLEGRADNGWISLAPFEAVGEQGAMRGFAVFNGSSLPAGMDMSLSADAFRPFGVASSTFDGQVQLAGAASDFPALTRLDGKMALFTSAIGLEHLAQVPLMREMMPYLQSQARADTVARCMVVQGPVDAGRLQIEASQLYADAGRIALRGSASLFGGPVDVDAAVQPAGEPVRYLSAVGSLQAPALAEDTRKAPWLNFDIPQDKVCALLRQQFEMSRNGR
ncbi:MAG: hypothetical protein AAF337_10760 [Pseudomonadota bacterium]